MDNKLRNTATLLRSNSTRQPDGANARTSRHDAISRLDSSPNLRFPKKANWIQSVRWFQLVVSKAKFVGSKDSAYEYGKNARALQDSACSLPNNMCGHQNIACGPQNRNTIWPKQNGLPGLGTRSDANPTPFDAIWHDFLRMGFPKRLPWSVI